MAVILGSATLQGSKVVIVPPVGDFSGIEAVRLSNYTSDALILSNIQSDRPGQEYLLPFQQNVYRQENVRQPPEITAVVLGAGFSTEAVLVEWSTEALKDFPGTYPQNLSQAALTGGLAAPAWDVRRLPVPNDGNTYTIPAEPRRVSLTFLVVGPHPVLYSHSDSNWGGRPSLATGGGRTIDTTAVVYLRATAAGDTEVEWFQTRFGPGDII